MQVQTEQDLYREITARDPGDRYGHQLDIAEAGRAGRLVLEILGELATGVAGELIFHAHRRAKKREKKS